LINIKKEKKNEIRGFLEPPRTFHGPEGSKEKEKPKKGEKNTNELGQELTTDSPWPSPQSVVSHASEVKGFQSTF